VYTVTGTDNVGCTGAATVLINVFPLSGLTFSTIPSEGCKPLDVDFNYVPGANIADSSWAWNFGDLFSANNTSFELSPMHTYANEGTYTASLTAVTTDGCTETGVATINVYTKPVADFYFSPSVATMDDPKVNMVNQSSGANTWYWNFDDPASGTLNESTEHLPSHTFSDTGTFNVILVASSNHGCADTTERLITIFPQILIFAPTAFTPDGNGLNEFFMPSIQGLISNKFEMHIFDRWGQEVYICTEIGKGWDGSVKGSSTIAPSAVYTWSAYYTDNLNKKYKIMGNVTLVR
jgi:gliding motility-associated-like protein